MRRREVVVEMAKVWVGALQVALASWFFLLMLQGFPRAGTRAQTIPRRVKMLLVTAPMTGVRQDRGNSGIKLH